MKPCIPPELQAKADAAQERKEAAIDRLAALAVELGALEEAPDPFERQLRALIDADARIIRMRARR